MRSAILSRCLRRELCAPDRRQSFNRLEMLALVVEHSSECRNDPHRRFHRGRRSRVFICIAQLPALVLELDAPPPATAFGAGVGQIEGLLQFRLEILDGERLLAMGRAPFGVSVKHLRRRKFVPGVVTSCSATKVLRWSISRCHPLVAERTTLG